MMICPLCDKEHNDPYVIKVQHIIPGGKMNLAEGRPCEKCAMKITVKIFGAKLVENGELEALKKTEVDK